VADERGEELPPEDILKLFKDEYLDCDQPLKLVSFMETPKGPGIECRAKIEQNGVAREITGTGNGPVAAFVHALLSFGVEPFEVVSYSEHSLGTGVDAKAVAYFEIKSGAGLSIFGAATDTNIEIASLKAVLSALNRASR
jgi:2-isopropylmalate synthase